MKAPTFDVSPGASSLSGVYTYQVSEDALVLTFDSYSLACTDGSLLAPRGIAKIKYEAKLSDGFNPPSFIAFNEDALTFTIETDEFY